MLKKSITFENYDGETVTRDYYFHMSKADLARMEMDHEGRGGAEAIIGNLIKERDPEKIIGMFDQIIGMAYGERSEDGQRFIKSPELFERFKQTEAYSELFIELLRNTEAVAEFITGMLPSSLSKNLQVDLPGEIDTLTKKIEETRTAHPVASPAVTDQVPSFALGPVEDKEERISASVERNEEQYTFEDLMHIKLPSLVALINNPAPKGTKVRSTIEQFDADQFKTLMKRFEGGNVPKDLLALAMRRF